ncbi:MAG: hypothetical protein AB1586_10760 [Pseudomonadota bacterium]|jgi:hypothetical protein
MTVLPLSTRYEVNSVVERLAADSEFFDPQDAKDLIRLIPIQRARWFGGGLGWSSTGNSSSGVAAGVGDVSVDDGKSKGYIGTDEGGHRIGGYRILHTPGLVEVSLMWSETSEKDGQVFQVHYNQLTKQPEHMDISYQATLSLGPLLFSLRRWRRWKTPDPSAKPTSHPGDQA